MHCAILKSFLTLLVHAVDPRGDVDQVSVFNITQTALLQDTRHAHNEK